MSNEITPVSDFTAAVEAIKALVTGPPVWDMSVTLVKGGHIKIDWAHIDIAGPDVAKIKITPADTTELHSSRISGTQQEQPDVVPSTVVDRRDNPYAGMSPEELRALAKRLGVLADHKEPRNVRRQKVADGMYVDEEAEPEPTFAMAEVDEELRIVEIAEGPYTADELVMITENAQAFVARVLTKEET